MNSETTRVLYKAAVTKMGLITTDLPEDLPCLSAVVGGPGLFAEGGYKQAAHKLAIRLLIVEVLTTD
jgi:hypothetical protein